MKNLERAWKKLSLTGRFCYLFMCVETYLVTRFPERDWTPVAKRCWQWTEDYWDKGWDIYSAVIPEFFLSLRAMKRQIQETIMGRFPKKTIKN